MKKGIKMGRRLIDLTGERFGKWVVLKKSLNKGTVPFWLCKCDCGNEVEVRGQSLRNGKSKQCKHCINIKDLTGERFGKLTVICKGSKKFKNQGIYWLCKCDCGIEKEIRGSSLIRGDYKSCGCYNIESRAERNKIEYGLASKRKVYRSYKHEAEERGLLFELSFSQFIDLTSKNCHYCNSEPSNKCSQDGNNGDFIYNGIDRKDNTKGYTIENCVSCCKICNRAKADMTYEDFIKWINKVYNNIRDKESTNESNRISSRTRGCTSDYGFRTDSTGNC
jgi:hypothetical protein